MKKSTLIPLVAAIISLSLSWVFMMAFILGGVRISLITFDAAKDGTLALYKRNQLIIVKPDGSERQYECKDPSPGRISIKGSTVKIESYNSYLVFDMEEETFGEWIFEATGAPMNASRKPVIAGDKEYSYKNRFFRYSIIEKRADGTESVRYTMPESEYVIKLGLFIFGASLVASGAFLLRSIIKNYRFTVEGKMVPRDTEKR
ncbi:MAG: hypothetical protein IIT70_07055 [Clostridia bacterium]|nr:hypothetical protein [Clostridia bacterium]MBQ5488593.1 hypothetical protein [Clostridia bacterium]